MKIAVQTPLKGDEIRALLDGLDKDGAAFTYTGKRGISLEFDVQGPGAENACAVAKSEIKATDWGKVLYFSVQEL